MNWYDRMVKDEQDMFRRRCRFNEGGKRRWSESSVHEVPECSTILSGTTLYDKLGPIFKQSDHNKGKQEKQCLIMHNMSDSPIDHHSQTIYKPINRDLYMELEDILELILVVLNLIK